MDDQRFDAITRRFGVSRRTALVGLLGAVAAGVTGRSARAQDLCAGATCASSADCCDGYGCHLQSIECVVRGNGTIGLGGLCLDDSDCRSGLACDPTGHCRLGPGQCSDEGGSCKFHDACCGLLQCIGYEATGTGVCGGGICGLVDTGCGDFGSGVLPCCDGFVCTERICQPAPPSTGSASVTIHVATCPTGIGSDIFNQCHDNVSAGVAFAVADKEVFSDANGVAGASINAGDVSLTEDSSTFASFLGAYVYCSVQPSGTVLYDGSADSGSVELTIGAGDDVICDWYNLTAASDAPPTSTPADSDGPGNADAAPTSTSGGATALPSTGIAPHAGEKDDLWLPTVVIGGATVAFIAAKQIHERSTNESE